MVFGSLVSIFKIAGLTLLWVWSVISKGSLFEFLMILHFFNIVWCHFLTTPYDTDFTLYRIRSFKNAFIIPTCAKIASLLFGSFISKIQPRALPGSTFLILNFVLIIVFKSFYLFLFLLFDFFSIAPFKP